MNRMCPFHKVEIPDTQECPVCVMEEARVKKLCSDSYEEGFDEGCNSVYVD